MFNFCRNQTENNNNVAEQFVLGVILGKVGICLYLFTFHRNQEFHQQKIFYWGFFPPIFQVLHRGELVCNSLVSFVVLS